MDLDFRQLSFKMSLFIDDDVMLKYLIYKIAKVPQVIPTNGIDMIVQAWYGTATFNIVQFYAI